MTLRTRLLAGVLALVAAGLAVSGVATHQALRFFLLDRVDQQLEAAVRPVASALGDVLAGRPPRLSGLIVPGVTYGALLRADGTVAVQLGARSEEGDGSSAPQPDIRPGDLEPGRSVTVGSQDGPGSFRLLASPDRSGALVIVAIPLDDVEQTLRRLVAIEAVASLTVLAAVAVVARWMVQRGLQPLEDIGRTAGAIAAGDLSRRVNADERSEVGRLGVALNSMLGQIESAFAARQASESRLRRFVADASHELRTPLTSIRGYAELFRRGASERPEDLAKAMRRIEEEAARMGVLVDDLLLLARLDQGRPLEQEAVDLARIASDAVDDARTVDPDRPITLAAPPAVPMTGDDARLRQVVSNLLANARQHTPPATPVHVHVSVNAGSALLEVADEGPGLPPEQAAKVFERFYRGDESRTRTHGGTGLGLAIVAAITEAHKGKVSLETAPGEGARFRVELPLSPPAD